MVAFDDEIINDFLSILLIFCFFFIFTIITIILVYAVIEVVVRGAPRLATLFLKAHLTLLLQFALENKRR